MAPLQTPATRATQTSLSCGPAERVPLYPFGIVNANMRKSRKVASISASNTGGMTTQLHRASQDWARKREASLAAVSFLTFNPTGWAVSQHVPAFQVWGSTFSSLVSAAVEALQRSPPKQTSGRHLPTNPLTSGGATVVAVVPP